MKSSELVDLMANATDADLRQLETEIKEQEGYLRRLRSAAKLIRNLVYPKVPKSPLEAEANAIARKIARFLRESGSSASTAAIASATGIDLEKVKSVLASDDWFDRGFQMKWKLSATGLGYAPEADEEDEDD